MKTVINITLGFLAYGIVGGMEMNSIGMKQGLISIIVIALVLCLINRKKSVTFRTRSGQAHEEQQLKCIHTDYTPKSGGVSSV